MKFPRNGEILMGSETRSTTQKFVSKQVGINYICCYTILTGLFEWFHWNGKRNEWTGLCYVFDVCFVFPSFKRERKEEGRKERGESCMIMYDVMDGWMDVWGREEAFHVTQQVNPITRGEELGWGRGTLFAVTPLHPSLSLSQWFWIWKEMKSWLKW